MTVKYSPSTKGIYTTELYDDFPHDAIEIDEDLYIQYQNGEFSGFDVENGIVVKHTMPQKTIEQIRAEMRCKSWQFKRALTQMGLRSAVDAAVAASDQDTKDMWDAPNFERLHPFVVSMAIALGKSDEEVDAVFTLANSFVQ
jgi:hypothetical protein